MSWYFSRLKPQSLALGVCGLRIVKALTHLRLCYCYKVLKFKSHYYSSFYKTSFTTIVEVSLRFVERCLLGS